MQGTLVNARIPDLLQSLGRDRESGVLEVVRDDIAKSIFFGRGSMVFARSTLHSDRLGECLVRRGDISRAHLALASNKMRARNLKLGATLVSLGLMTELDVQNRLADQITGIICSVFPWDDGDYRFERGAGLLESDVTLDLPTVPIILEGTRLMDPRLVRAALGDVGRPVSHTKDPALIDHYANLTPQTGFVLSRVDGSASLADIVAMSPLAEVDTLRCLYGLLSGGFIEIGEKSRAVAPSKQKPSPAIDDVLRVSAGAAFGTRETETSSTAEVRRIRERIEAKYEAVRSGTYYDWLEIGRTADFKELKRAFARLIKQYHPDRNPPEVVASVGRKLETIVSKVTEAHEALADTTSRRRFDNSLRTEAPKGEIVATRKRPEPEPPPPPSSAVAVAERYYQEARKFYDASDFHQVTKLMEEAVRLSEKTGRYHRLLAQALRRNPKWRKSAEESFKKALMCDRFDAESMVGLAELYESVGLVSRAQSLFAEASEIDPLSAIRWRQTGAVK